MQGQAGSCSDGLTQPVCGNGQEQLVVLAAAESELKRIKPEAARRTFRAVSDRELSGVEERADVTAIGQMVDVAAQAVAQIDGGVSQLAGCQRAAKRNARLRD